MCRMYVPNALPSLPACSPKASAILRILFVDKSFDIGRAI